jgi:hypothetical protein
MAERTPEDVASGILRISVGGTVKAVPTLKMKYVDEWGMLVAAGDPTAKVPAEWTAADVGALSGRGAARLLDLVVAYDRTGALGGREWLEENADPAQLYEAVAQMVGNAFPLVSSPTVLVDLMLLRPGSVKSTNGRSRHGVSTPTGSGVSSTRSS